MDKKNSKKPVIILVAVIAIIAVAAGILYNSFSAEEAKHPGEKTVTVNVVLPDETKTFEHTTREVYLRGLFEEMQIVEGEESDYGLYVKTVCGVTVNDSNEEWWNFRINGQTTSTGVETALFADGDVIDIVLMQGYENF
ncbi:MAG: DUF4430 domain-containing protein [Clostridia bacterium]|nr:DUF4430 domain-containing protein [Clostridia bacterium]